MPKRSTGREFVLEAKTMDLGGGNSIIAHCEFKLVCEKHKRPCLSDGMRFTFATNLDCR